MAAARLDVDSKQSPSQSKFFPNGHAVLEGLMYRIHGSPTFPCDLIRGRDLVHPYQDPGRMGGLSGGSNVQVRCPSRYPSPRTQIIEVVGKEDGEDLDRGGT